MRERRLLVIDVGSGNAVFIEEAHDGTIWSLDLEIGDMEGIGIIIGSVDQSVKFWNMEQRDEDASHVRAGWRWRCQSWR